MARKLFMLSRTKEWVRITGVSVEPRWPGAFVVGFMPIWNGNNYTSYEWVRLKGEALKAAVGHSLWPKGVRSDVEREAPGDFIIVPDLVKVVDEVGRLSSNEKLYYLGGEKERTLCLVAVPLGRPKRFDLPVEIVQILGKGRARGEKVGDVIRVKTYEVFYLPVK